MNSQSFDEERIVTLQEFIDEEEKSVLNLTTAMKLCTYSLSNPLLEKYGIVGRVPQMMFSCLSHNRNNPLILCAACVSECHSECKRIVELGQCNQLRCDCPTSRSDIPCLKQPLGAPNYAVRAHDQNCSTDILNGTFCSCKKAYDINNDTMFQCVSCNDWYHDIHLPGYMPEAPPTHLICPKCVDSHPFLRVFKNVSSSSLCTRTDNDEFRLQPWHSCLSCTEGKEGDFGVCLNCSNNCHSHHVLSKPRISNFFCDCQDLLSKYKEVQCSCRKVVSVEKRLRDYDEENASSPNFKRTRLSPEKNSCNVNVNVVNDTSVSPTMSVLSPGSEIVQASNWTPLYCASKSSNTESITDDTSPPMAMYLDNIQTDLIPYLCLCDDCYRLYAKSGVLSWFINTSLNCIASDCNSWKGLEVNDIKEGPSSGSSNDFLSRLNQPIGGSVLDTSAFSDIKTKMVEFLSEFAKSGSVVTKADIDAFVKSLQDSK